MAFLAATVLAIAALWQVFSKAGRPGWGALVPIHSLYLLRKVAGKSGWRTILLVIPLVNLVLSVPVWHGVSKAFGHGDGFTGGVVLLGVIVVPTLGFGQSEHRAPAPSYPA